MSNLFMELFYTLKSTFNHLNRLPMMPPIIPIFNIECIKKGFPFPQVSDFAILLKKYKTCGNGNHFFIHSILKVGPFMIGGIMGSLLRGLKVDFNV